MTVHGLNQSQLEDLASFDTPTICNAIELFDVRPRNVGYMDGSIKACFPKMPPMVGYALTSTFRSMSQPREGDVYASMSKQVEAYESLPGPPVITFQDLDEPVTAATFGEVMCTTYQAFGAQGLITSGAGRDLDQVEAIGFPVFTNGAICAHAYCHILAVGVPVSVGGLTVYQGDLLHGDLNGVTTIPHEIADRVADACRGLMEAEDVVLGYVRGENITPDGLSEARAECAAMMKKLSEELRA